MTAGNDFVPNGHVILLIKINGANSRLTRFALGYVRSGARLARTQLEPDVSW